MQPLPIGILEFTTNLVNKVFSWLLQFFLLFLLIHLVFIYYVVIILLIGRKVSTLHWGVWIWI